MPYLAHLYCESCGEPFNLDVDYAATIRAYQKDGRPTVAINSPTVIWDYLVYSCARCGKQFKLTCREVEKMVRVHLSSQAVKYKLYLDELATFNETEEARKSGEFFRHHDKETKQRLSSLYGNS